MADGLLVFAPLRIEAAVLPRRRGWTVIRSGMGPARARVAAARGLAVDARAVCIVGLCAAASPELRSGDVVCATELRTADATLPVESATLADLLRDEGFRVQTGPVFSTERITNPDERRRLDGILAVDMESAWLAGAADGRPLAVVRVVVEEADRNLVDVRTAAAGIKALRNLRRAAAVLDEWADAAQPDGTRAYLGGDEGRRPQEVSA
jgi:4-hydroxy-3-methylbut-2-en-1-yl diphosphate reductase